MVRIIVIMGAISAIVLLAWLLSGERPEEETELPAFEATGVSVNDEAGADPDAAAFPPPGDVSLEADEQNIEVTRDPNVTDELREVTMPKGERKLDIEVDETRPATESEAEDDPDSDEMPETGDDQPPER